MLVKHGLLLSNACIYGLQKLFKRTLEHAKGYGKVSDKWYRRGVPGGVRPECDWGSIVDGGMDHDSCTSCIATDYVMQGDSGKNNPI